MRFCYAFRRFSDYPYLGNAFDMDPKRLSDKFLNRVKEMGFDGIELGMECLDRVGGEKKLSELATRLESFGTPVLAIRSGGLMIDPKTGEENVERVKRAIKFAKILNSEVINGAISGPPKSPYIDTGSKLIASASANQAGFYYSLNSSRDTTLPQYEMLAKKYVEICDLAKEAGLNISCEVHQNSPVDNKSSEIVLTFKSVIKNTLAMLIPV